MSFVKRSMAVIAAVGLTATPVMAQAASPAAKLSLADTASSVRAGAPMEDASEARGGSIILALIAAGLIIAGIIIALGGGDDDPDSP